MRGVRMNWPILGPLWSVVAALALALAPSSTAWAVYDSGFDPGKSLGTYVAAEGVNDVIQIPPSGVLHYDSFTVPEGVVVTFAKNADNTGVWILSGGDILIEGVVSVEPQDAPEDDSASDKIYKIGEEGGPGGHNGGVTLKDAIYGTNGTLWQRGHGPGGGIGENADGSSPLNGPDGGDIDSSPWAEDSWIMLTGGGGAAAEDWVLGEGGGGGGVITLASSTTIRLDGEIEASTPACPCGNAGGAGIVRLISDSISGDGVIDVQGGYGSGPGSVRLEAHFFDGEMFNNIQPDQHEPIVTAPQVAVPYPESQRPRVTIASVNGSGPSNERGHWPANVLLSNGVAFDVVVQAEYMPVGVPGLTVRMNPAGGDEIVHEDVVLAGTLESSSATVTFTLPQGTRVGVFEAWWVKPIPITNTD